MMIVIVLESLLQNLQYSHLFSDSVMRGALFSVETVITKQFVY
jgi:hypothetical protein